MSTELALLTQKEHILTGFDNNKRIALDVFIDVPKAFDRISHYIMLTKLEINGFKVIFQFQETMCQNQRKYFFAKGRNSVSSAS